MIATITRWVLAHKRLVVVFWIVLTVVGAATSGAASNAMKQKFSVPGKEGWQANQEITRLYHGTGGNASGAAGGASQGIAQQWIRSQPGELPAARHCDSRHTRARSHDSYAAREPGGAAHA